MGSPWRDLPTEFGAWQSIYNQFNRWSKKGVWERLFFILRGELDSEWHFIDATIVKAHEHSIGVNKSKPEKQRIGKSAGGNTTKIHMLCDSHGNPIDFELTQGQVHDVRLADVLIKRSDAEYLVADMGYDSGRVRTKIKKKGSILVIPAKINSKKNNPDFDKTIYKLRHLVENLFAKLKNYRAISTRIDRYAQNFKSTIYLGCMPL